jgi:hypothetical protein
MADNNLGPKSNFIPEVVAGVKEAHSMVMDKYKTKIKKIVSGVKHTFKQGKEYGQKDILNGGDK